MQAIELETQIQNDGQICLPERYKSWFGKHAKLILLGSTESESFCNDYCGAYSDSTYL